MSVVRKKRLSRSLSSAKIQKVGITVEVLSDYAPQDNEEMALAAGQRVRLLDVDESGWMLGAVDGRQGWFPCSHVSSASAAAPHDPSDHSITRSRKEVEAILSKFLAGNRPEWQLLEERNIIHASPQASAHVAVAQKQLDKANKKQVLGRFLKSKDSPKAKKAAAAAEASIFGRPLEESCSGGGTVVTPPIVVAACAEWLEEHGHIAMPGIFRIAGSHDVYARVKQQLTSPDQRPELDGLKPADVADLLKGFLRELPEPLLTYDNYDPLIAALSEASIGVGEREKMIAAYLRAVPRSNQVTVAFLLPFLKRVSAHADTNLMHPANLAVVFGPILLAPRIATLENAADITKIIQLVTTLIQWGSTKPPPPMRPQQ